MKNHKKTITKLLTTAVLLITVFMTAFQGEKQFCPFYDQCVEC